MKGLSPLGMEFWHHGKAADCPVYDMHGHMGRWSGIYFSYAEPEQMIPIMDRSGVEMLVFSHHSALSSPDLSNHDSIEAVRKFPGRLKAYYVINPNDAALIEQDLRIFRQNRDVFVGLKFHPAMHEVSLLDPKYQIAWEAAQEGEWLVLLHTWGGHPFCGESVVRELALRYPCVKMIMGHACHGRWEEAAALVREFPNVYLDLCAVLDERSGIVEKFIHGAGSEKILFGTDFPWFNHHYYIGGVLAAEISDDDRRNIFYKNAIRLLANVK